jgi:hypothetical protein
MPAPLPWRIRCVASRVAVAADPQDEVKAWYDRQSKEWKRKFADRLFALRGLPFDEWRTPLFRWLRGNGQGLGEIRFKANGVQQRPLGFRGPEPDVFTIVLPSVQEKNDRFVPATALADAQRIKSDIEANHERTVDCWLFRNS